MAEVSLTPEAEVDALRAKIDAHRPFTPDLVLRMQRWLVPQFLFSSDGLGAKDALTLAEMTVFLERGIVAGGHQLERFLAIRRHRQALELTEQRAREGGLIDVAFLRELHRLLTTGAPGEARPGEFKTKESAETRRRGRAFRYASPADVPALLQKLCEELTARLAAGNPLQAVAWFYYHLHLIHPFEHGNGQVGRLAASCVLLHHGFPAMILDPRDAGGYLDALAACDLTAPAAMHAPLSPRLDAAPLLIYLCEGLRRTGQRLLDIVEGRDIESRDMPERVAEGQQRLLEAMLAQKDLSWRVRGSFEVRALHDRLLAVARALESKGPLYTIRIESQDVLRSHAVWREFITAIPAGDAGLVGQLELVLQGETASNLRLPAPARLRCVTVGSQLGLQLLLQWDDQKQPKSQPGPARAEEWPEVMLDRWLARAVDSKRKAFELLLVEENLSAAAQARIKALLEEQPGRTQLRLRRAVSTPAPGRLVAAAPAQKASGRLKPAAAKAVSGSTAPGPAAPGKASTLRIPTPPPLAPAPSSRTPAPSSRAPAPLDGLRPAEPPLNF